MKRPGFGPRESAIESYLKKFVEARGGLCVKIVPTMAGMPDRLVVLPGRTTCFVELKRPKGGRVSPIQQHVHEHLRALGADVYLINEIEQIKETFR